MCKSIKRLVMIAIVLAAAIIPAAASARPVPPDIAPYSVGPPAAQHVSATPSSGFSWHDAGFGAAAMLVLIGVGTGAAVVMRRRSTRPVIG
jgi:hypothetical protein